ncbi:hypothetical protein [Pseudobacteriovorax antillogorgiicola]|uniref:Uncharacterized protein n=1 Tax=Pseudobacteriovorax antillogorgiicola TaxID=1513793 RepID=A0A1Y6B856_9BACT|nr:hypothetical protein [Pseudobacteriovorax antillogorgiicola]TCS59228.1 hypothetical protein EDD56_101131 [Pseudobacteriovorax antillogorgiicola]SME90348.1 hypothetical protein SAMN06296036_101355 [Pseudobacteriovorax antillogorgiicola]
MFRLGTAILFFLVSGSHLAHAELDREVELKAERLSLRLDPQLFSSIALSHQNLQRIDLETSEPREDASLHVRGRIGTSFWGGQGELYGTFGAIKKSQSLKVIQKRPYLELDLYPWISPFGQIAIYQMLHLPFAESDYNPDYGLPSQQGSIYTIGLAPTFLLPIKFDWFNFHGKVGADIWTRLYSREQVVLAEHASQDALSLIVRDEVAESSATMQAIAKLGFAISPLYLKRAVFSVTSYIKMTHYPYYDLDEQGRLNDRYKVKKESYHRVELDYAIATRIVLSNDFYYHYTGFFSGRTRGAEPALRNIMRVTYHL